MKQDTCIYNHMEDKTLFKVGSYYRLSREDGDDLESESIANQRDMIHSFLKREGLTFVDEYIDDGYSGGNFNRPDFQRLLTDLELGKINTVVTKDLSRLGRDHIETGRYVERFFPENGIRYIAIADDIDTFSESATGFDLMPFRLGMNDMYAKDTSKKVRNTLKNKRENGLYVAGVPSYGYKKDPNNKYQLIVDPDTAPTVKRIFDLYVAGYGPSEIAEILTCDGLPTPIALKNRPNAFRRADHPEIWKKATVNNILKNRTYTGCTIQHCTEKISYKTNKRRKIPESQWVVKEHAHEAIVSKELFEVVQAMRNRANHYSADRRDVEYVLGGLMFCKDCGATMGISYDKTRDRVMLNCNNYKKFSKYDICSSHYMSYTKVEQIVLKRIQEGCQKLNSLQFEKMLQQNIVDPQKMLEKKIASFETKIQTLEKKLETIYEDKLNQVITESMFKQFSKNASEQIESHRRKLEELLNEKKSFFSDESTENRYKKVVDEFLAMKKPTKEMMYRLIDKIYITKDKTIEIHYKIKCFDSIL